MSMRRGGPEERAGTLTLIRDQFMPKIPANVFWPSLALGFLLMIGLSAKQFQHIPIRRAGRVWLNSTTYVLDVGIIQFVSLCLLILLAYRYFRFFSPVPPRVLTTGLCLFFLSVVLLEVAAEGIFLKPSFHYGRPGDSLSECYITSRVLRRLGFGGEEGTSAPSGFAMRQTIILLCFLVLSHQKRWRQVFSRTESRWLHFVQYGFFVSVLALRFYRGRHSLFDLGVGIGVATVFFWLTFVVASCLLVTSPENRAYLEHSFGAFPAYALAILFYCQETAWWLAASFVIAIILAAVHHYCTAQSRRRGLLARGETRE